MVPKALFERLNALIMACQRGKFFIKAGQEQIAILEQIEAIEASAGAWSDEAYPELIDNEAIDNWLAQLRSGWQQTNLTAQ
jgi:hypothetical protein